MTLLKVLIEETIASVVDGVKVDRGEWHSKPVDHKLLVTRERQNTFFIAPIPFSRNDLIHDCKPNMPWAEAHFLERVSEVPFNPPPSHRLWPWAHEEHQDEEEKFSHTYPERMWPKRAGDPTYWRGYRDDNRGIRFPYGDLNDVALLLYNRPMTRQAFLPMWFPEDTGAVHQERVPCTIGYHFMVTEENVNRLNLWYTIRSCDAVRHFRDDVYMACRLAQWMLGRLKEMSEGKDTSWHNTELGMITFHAFSFHCMEGDVPKLEKQYGRG